MRRFLVLVVVIVFAPVALAKVWTTVYRCDETTPLAAVDPNHPNVYRDIMVGTRLVIVISSDAKGPWSGALLSSWDDRVYGELSARGYNQKTRSYAGSCLEAAGTNPFTRIFQDDDSIGLQFSSRLGGVPGDWFIVNYRAQQLGPCDVGLYNLNVSYDVPIETLSFTHVPSRDFDGNSIVDFKDFGRLASHWGLAVGPDPNSPETTFDLNSDSHIDIADLALFSEHWLERTDCSKSAIDPNSPSPNL